jgi:glycosyltransferase involved in cell wall biosynthesis
MRIAYITPYQGPTLVKQRPIIRNRSMSNKVKIELIAEALSKNHAVEIISHGEVIEPKFKLYRGFQEPNLFSAKIPVWYASAFPVRKFNALWSSFSTVHLLKTRHKATPFDLVIIFNAKPSLIACAKHAIDQLKLPVILEYEDDAFVNVVGQSVNGVTARTGSTVIGAGDRREDTVNAFAERRHQRACRELFKRVAGVVAVSPYLLSQFPAEIPKVLLRGVVGEDIRIGSKNAWGNKRNVVLFSGTHVESNGVSQLITAWRNACIKDWELHITGYGHLTEQLREMAMGIQGITFHGLVARSELIRLMCSAKICINPHAVSKTPGNVFAFKIIEYIAAGAHVITTPMGNLEREIEEGVTYMKDNEPDTIVSTLKTVMLTRGYQRTATTYVCERFSRDAVSEELNSLLRKVRESVEQAGKSFRS